MNETQPSATTTAPPRRFGLLKKILLLLAVAIMTLVVVILLQPNEYRVQRNAVMNAPPATVFAQVDDFHNWDKWSPWAKLDPNMKVTY